MINWFCKKLNIKQAIWNYTAAGHGKSVADGIGGCVKNICNREVLLGRDVLSAQDIVDILPEKSTILFFCVDKDCIDEIQMLIPKALKAINKTMRLHQVAWTSQKLNELSFRFLSCTDCDANLECKHYNLAESKVNYQNLSDSLAESSQNHGPSTSKSNPAPKYNIGDWVAANFD